VNRIGSEIFGQSIENQAFDPPASIQVTERAINGLKCFDIVRLSALPYSLAIFSELDWIRNIYVNPSSIKYNSNQQQIGPERGTF
jgi:hypothetical protein